jgi:hypothetical protein
LPLTRTQEAQISTFGTGYACTEKDSKMDRPTGRAGLIYLSIRLVVDVKRGEKMLEGLSSCLGSYSMLDAEL